MRRALRLARRGWGQVSPNPLVGAVVVRDGALVADGWHARFGEPHAETMALRAAGARAKDATLYVTLEPCNHFGKQPPCTDAVIEAGIARVVMATRDPNPMARGGLRRLERAGIIVDVGIGGAASRAMNAPFHFAWSGAPRPFVTLKLALTIDGALADAARTPGWFTSAASRRAVHAMRASADAIAVGRATLAIDDPALTVREGWSPRVPPARVVFSRSGEIPLASRLVRTAGETPVWAVGRPANGEALRDAGVTLLSADTLTEGMAALHARGIRHLFVEGGATLGGALLDAGFVDRLVIFRAPLVLGAGALPAFAGLGTRDWANAVRFRPRVRRPIGDDLLEIYTVEQP
jgi:diaminohydroxyphosphoribosylaminopyrimidine deaminase/5-amino-6-(5-phosphoribosylamino)uracil reductase